MISIDILRKKSRPRLISESQSSRVLKGLLKTIWSNSTAQARPPRPGCLGLCPDSFCLSSSQLYRPFHFSFLNLMRFLSTLSTDSTWMLLFAQESFNHGISTDWTLLTLHRTSKEHRQIYCILKHNLKVPGTVEQKAESSMDHILWYPLWFWVQRNEKPIKSIILQVCQVLSPCISNAEEKL